MYNKMLPWGWISCLTLFCILIYACDSEIDPDISGPGNPGGGSNPPAANQLAPNVASEHLVLENAMKVTGDLPISKVANALLDVEDTIFVVKGYPLGYRLEALHPAGQNASSFNVYLPGSTFYFNVPETIDYSGPIPEQEDSTSILVLDFDPPQAEVDYPYNQEVIIQPLDDTGEPIGEISRIITVEDPDNSNGSCDYITRPQIGLRAVWNWDFSIRKYNGQILNVLAPGQRSTINSTGSGCCSSQGRSYTVQDSPLCVPNVSNANMTWVTLEVNDFVTIPYETLLPKDDGSIQIFSGELKKQYDIATTDFCSGEVGYVLSNDSFHNNGTHDFTPGATSVNFEFSNWNGPRIRRGGDIIYTCNTLIVEFGVDDNWSVVYRKQNLDNTIFDFADEKLWFP